MRTFILGCWLMLLALALPALAFEPYEHRKMGNLAFRAALNYQLQAEQDGRAKYT
jgi:hypothetical protein